MRDYQLQIIDQIEQSLSAGVLRIMLAVSTGAGKTHIARDIIRARRERGEQVAFIVDRRVLVEQAVEVFSRYGFQVGIIQAESTSWSFYDDVVVCSVQSLRTRSLPANVKLMFIDEAHQLTRTHIHVLRGAVATPIIGLSATPLTQGLGRYFDLLVRGPSIHDLTEQRYLVPVEAYSLGAEQLVGALASLDTSSGEYRAKDVAKLFRRDVVIGDAIRNYIEHGENRPALAFCVNQAHARDVAAEFIAEGIPATTILADTEPHDRARLLRDFNEGRTRVLVSVAVLSAGFDAPVASCAILLRPTLSMALHIQQVGRVLRSLRDSDDNERLDGIGFPVKEKALIFDHAGNCTRHGLPGDFWVPDLNDETHITASKLRQKVDRLIACRQCKLVLANDAEVCPRCGAERPQRSARIQYLDGDLVRMHEAQERDKAAERESLDVPHSEEEKRIFYLGCRFYYQVRGKNPNVAFYIYQDKFGEKPPYEWNHLPPVPTTPEVLRYIKSRNIRWSKGRAKASRSQSSPGSESNTQQKLH